VRGTARVRVTLTVYRHLMKASRNGVAQSMLASSRCLFLEIGNNFKAITRKKASTMNSRQSKTSIAIGVSAGLIGIVAGIFPFRVQRFHDNRVVGGEIVRALDFIGPHLSRRQFISVAGKTYYGVRGSSPFYLDLPTLHSILFVTEQMGGRVTFHLVNMETKEHLAFDGGTGGFGGYIGSARKPGEPFTDYVESATSDEIVLVKRSGDWADRTILNLKTKVVEQGGTFHLNQATKTNRNTKTQ
jgi:hypothetical protein